MNVTKYIHPTLLVGSVSSDAPNADSVPEVQVYAHASLTKQQDHITTLFGALIDTNDHGVVTLEGLKSQLLLGLDAHLPQLGNFLGEDSLGCGSRVDTVGLDGDDDTTADLQEETSVETDDTGLIGLGNVGKDAVDHADEHTVLEGVTGILNDRDDVCAVGGHVDQITTGAVGELDSEDGSLRAYNIGNVGDGGTGGSTKVKNLGSRAHVDVVDTTEDTSSQLGTEGVPDTVLDGRRGGLVAALSLFGTNAYALLAVDALTGGQVLGNKEVLLSTGNEDTSVAMGLDNNLTIALLVAWIEADLGMNLRSATGAAASTTTSTAARTATRSTAAASTTSTVAETTATTATGTATATTITEAAASTARSEASAATTVTTATSASTIC